MAKIRDYAVTIYSTATASMVCEMPTHETGDLLVAFCNKDSASNFTTPGGWTANQTQTSAGAAGGVYTKRAASSSETVTFTLTSETCCAVVIAVKNVNGSTAADAVSGSAKSGADDSTLPLAGVGITPGHNNCLVIHGLSTDTGLAASAYPPWVNLFAGDAGANSLCVAYTQQKTAAAITAPDHWAGAADDSRGFVIAIRDDGNGDAFDCYLPLTEAVPALMVSPLTGTTGTVDKGAYIVAASIVITSVAGKTVTGVTVGTTADSGVNPFRGSTLQAGVSSTTNLCHTEFDLTSNVDLTGGEGLLFGTYNNTAPRDYVDTGKATQGGKYILVGSSTANYRAWVIGGQFSKTEKADARNNYLIEVASSDTIYATAGTVAMASADYFAFGSAGYYGAASVRWSELYRLGVFVLGGGAAAEPFTFDEIVFTVNNGGGILPLMQQTGSGAMLWCPLKFGGTDPVHVGCNLNTFQYPRKADEVDYVDFHVSNNKVGIEFEGLDRGSGDVDTIHFTNCVFTSPSSYYWRFGADHDADADVDFTGSSVVNAAVTLRSTVTLSSMAFIDCSSFTANAAALDACSFSGTTVASDWLAAITNCAFVQGGTESGHAITTTQTGSVSIDGNTFSGYGPTEFGFHTNDDVNASTDVVTKVAHGYTTGDAIEYLKHGLSDSMGLTNATTYYVRAVTADTLGFYTTAANAIADTSRIALTQSGGTDTHYINSLKAAIYNNSGNALAITVTGGGDLPSVRNGHLSTTTVEAPVSTTITVLDTAGSPITGARVLITASNGSGTMPYQESATLVQSTNIVTATCTAHGLVAGQKVLVKGANQIDYNGVYTVGSVTTNTFTYLISNNPASPATGTIVVTGVVLSDTTNGSGIATASGTHAVDQPITGRVRKATSGTLYKTGTITGTVDSVNGFSATVQLIPDA